MITVSVSDMPSVKQRLFRTRAEDTLPLKIEHQRIYILPTRRGLAYLACLLIMLVTAVNYALSLGYALCFLLTGMFAASLLHTYRNIAGITVENIKASPAFCGDTARFKLDYKNTSNFTRHGICAKALDASCVCDVEANTTQNTKLELPTSKRGYAHLGRVTLTSTYPLGLWRSWCYVHSDSRALVYPKPEQTPPPLPVQSLAAEGEQRKREQQGDIAGLRGYVPGDTPSTIAWKAAARGQGLKSKMFDAETGGGDTCLSLQATGETDLEKQLSRLCAWVLQAERQNLNYTLDLSNVNTASNVTGSNKQNALAQLAQYRIGG